MSLLDEGRVSLDLQVKPEGVREFIDPEQVAMDVQIDPNNIENNLLNIAAIYNRYAHFVAMARIQRDGFKSRRKLLAAKLDKAYRDEAIEAGEKLTNPQVLALVEANPALVEVDMQLNEASAVLAACQETLSAISMKRDMLVQLNKNRAQEWGMSTGRVAGNAKPNPQNPADLDLSDVM